MSQQGMSQDREFEAYMRGTSELSNVYADLPDVAPPDHLDAAILAEAHRAVGARPGARPKRGWTMPLSMVASLFALVMIGLQLPHLLRERAATRLPSEQPAVAAAAQGALRPSPAQEPARAEEKPVLAANKKKAESAPAPPVAAMSPAPEAAAAAPAARLKDQTEAEGDRAPERARRSASHNELMIAPGAAATAPAAAMPEAKEGAKEGAKEDAGAASERPEDWLGRIRRLQQQGKRDEARKELAAFRKRYPDYAVPKALERE